MIFDGLRGSGVERPSLPAHDGLLRVRSRRPHHLACTQCMDRGESRVQVLALPDGRFLHVGDQVLIKEASDA